jgi:hypothetical protein
MKRLVTLLSIVMPMYLMAQTTLTGEVQDENGKLLSYATVALLRPTDSTLAFFGITNDQGIFEIKRISQGNYQMQVSSVGFQTFYLPLKMPEKSGDFGIVILKALAINLAPTEIVASYIPIVIKKDTIEYNAAAFKTKPDAVAEDLLKKLPGMEVDRAGNIKAMGEDVKNVMVDGKEFFSSDPKVATKNLPADAISKVQVYDKKSESAELAGIDDGIHDKTINLLLKEGKKQAWLGDIKAGAGTSNHYTTSAKVYRFTSKNQFALLGMMNNINQFGFSFRDYIDFNGGLPTMAGSGSMKISISDNNDIPVDFGQTINGLVTSGAGGLNYSFEPKKNSRFYSSYLGNGSKRDLQQSISTRNFTPGNEYNMEEEHNEVSKNFANKLNLGWKDKSDSTRTLLFNANIGLTNANEDVVSTAKSYYSGNLINDLESQAQFDNSDLIGNGAFTFMKRGRGVLKLLTFGASAGFNSGLSNSDRLNLTRYLGNPEPLVDHQFRDKQNNSQRYGLSESSLIRIAKSLYLEPELRANMVIENSKHKQGISNEGKTPIDSLSPDFGRTSFQLTPGLNLRKNTKKSKIEIGLALAMVHNHNLLNDTSSVKSSYNRLLPRFSWDFDYKSGHRISLNYVTTVNEPLLTLMVPIVENQNPQSLVYGNRYLKPETLHDFFVNWLLFDQFSQTSVFARAGGAYTRDKIGYSSTVNDSLVQQNYILNTKDAYRTSVGIEFSTPLKFSGLNIHLAIDGSWDKGQAFINEVESINTNLSRSYKLSFDNLKKNKWDIDFGAVLGFTNSKYSLQNSMNNRYFNLNYFADLTFSPNDTWHFGVKSDVVYYRSKSFTTDVNIPLLNAEISYNFLVNKRGMLTLEVNDLLNKNTGISRTGEMNYLRETRSNIIGRYLILSFKYRINKAAKSSGGMEINVRKR